MTQPAPRVVFVGPPAAGKTRVGKRLARLLGVEFVDTDTEITRAHGPIAEIFSSRGEPAFRIMERDAVVSALGTTGVVALGGGAITSAHTRRDLVGHTVALITISADAVAHRLNPAKRPLLAAGVGAWENLVTARQAWYDEVSQVTFDTSHQAVDSVAEDVLRWLEGKESRV